MSEFPKGLIPLSEINEDPQSITDDPDYYNVGNYDESGEGIPAPSVRFAVNLPNYVPTDMIGVNLRRISVLSRLGGIRQLIVTSSEENKRERSVPLIVGFDSKGNAVAARGGKQTIDPTFTKNGREISPSSFNIPFQATWLESRINLNSDEICNRINVKGRAGGLRSAENWILELDKAIREGIQSIGISHLTGGLKKRDWRDIATYYLCGAASLPIFGLNAREMMISEVSVLLCGAVLSYINSLKWEKWRKDTRGGIFAELRLLEYRRSFIYGPQLDRAIALKLLSSFRGVIQPIK